MQSTMWYVAVNDRTVGPVPTELIIRGIERGKVPPTAYVCAAGDSEWQALPDVPEFEALVRPSQPPPPFWQAGQDSFSGTPFASSPPPPPASVSVGRGAPLPPLAPPLDPFARARAVAPPAAQPLVTHTSVPLDATETTVESPLPAYDPLPPLPLPPHAKAADPEQSPQAPPALVEPQSEGVTRGAPREPGLDGLPEAVHGRTDGVDIEITLDTFDDETRPRTYNFAHPIVEFFSPVENLELPNESMLIQGLGTTPTSLLVQQEAMWNIALCLAFGKEPLRRAAAKRFFETVAQFPEEQHLQWMSTTLQSKGFLPSGIPRDAGLRGIAALENHCPDAMYEALSEVVEG